eukprot:15365875-Ditylum_brightwellii.AAC.1
MAPREIRSNAQSVDCTSGGGANGHLGLVCDAAAYASIPGTALFVHSAMPGPIVLPVGATQYQIAQARDQQEEEINLFREVTSMERTIIQQIVKDLDTKYLMAIWNPVTNKITKTIPEIMEYLFDTYCDVSPAQLQELCQHVKNITLDPSEPVDTIYTQINTLSDLATIAKAPITDPQKINYVYLTLHRAGKFNSSLTLWNTKPPAGHTWSNYQLHFRDAQKALKKTGTLTIQDGMNHTEMINLVAEGIKKALNMNNEKKVEQINMAQNNEVSALQQQLAEIWTLIESMQKGQQNVSFPTANAVAQQPMLMPTPMQQWQQPLQT